MKTAKQNSGHHLEALDRSYVISSMFDAFITGHPFINAHPEIKALVEKISMDLGQLYQKIGAADD